jgi:class 3 adenylate cyclase
MPSVIRSGFGVRYWPVIHSSTIWSYEDDRDTQAQVRCYGEPPQAWHDRVPVVDLPRKIRFGIARGTVYELRRANSSAREYIGFCINLASRLQKYCPDLAFIASARIGLREDVLAKNGYVRVVAKDIRGFPQEIVIVDKDEYNGLPSEAREKYFTEL